MTRPAFVFAVERLHSAVAVLMELVAVENTRMGVGLALSRSGCTVVGAQSQASRKKLQLLKCVVVVWRIRKELNSSPPTISHVHIKRTYN